MIQLQKKQLCLLDFSHLWLHRNLYGGFNIFIHKLKQNFKNIFKIKYL